MMTFKTILIFCVIGIGSGIGQNPGAAIRGQVIDGHTREALAGVNLMVVGKYIGASTDWNGRFLISRIPAGDILIKASYIGYADQILPMQQVLAGDTVDLEIMLTEKPIDLKAITITPGQISIMQSNSTAMRTLSRKDIETLPQFGEDIYRAINRLPGVSANDYTAKFTVRGGEHEEVLVLLDGMELQDPFHLKDINGGALSVIDVAAVEGIELMSGGFSAEYGNRMSGVFNMHSRQPPLGQTRYSAGISFMNARAMTEGTFDNGRGSYLVSARRGYLDIVLKLTGEDESIKPTYYDLLGKVQYQLNPNHVLSLNSLFARDINKVVEDDDDRSHTTYANAYVWSTLTSRWSDRLLSQTVGSFTNVGHTRKGLAFLGGTTAVEFDVADRRGYDALGLKQDWLLDLSDRWILKWGGDLRKYYADYDYFYSRFVAFVDAGNDITSRLDTNAADFTAVGHTLGLYAANRFRISDPLVAEIGLRYDHASYSRDRLLSPRVNLSYQLSDRTTLRTGWGYYYQPGGIHQMKVEDGERAFFKAQKAEHRVIGLEHLFPNRIQLRIDAYYKRLSALRPSYRNLTNELEIFPELQDDRVLVDRAGTVSKGLEFYVKQDAGGHWTWWASYAFARVTDDVRTIQFRGQTIPFNKNLPGTFDQRHTLYLDANYRPSPEWQINLAWQYHTGWRYTQYVLLQGVSNQGIYYYNEPRKLYGNRYPAYHRLDIRINRAFQTKRSGVINVFFELVNVYDWRNIRAYLYEIQGDGVNPPFLVRYQETWLPRLPSIGVMWEFAK